jgi:hypothetical protein
LEEVKLLLEEEFGPSKYIKLAISKMEEGPRIMGQKVSLVSAIAGIRENKSVVAPSLLQIQDPSQPKATQAPTQNHQATWAASESWWLDWSCWGVERD